jgi:hypothetical protein
MWFPKFLEKGIINKVVDLEQQWSYGNESNLHTLLSYLKHPSGNVRSTAALAIGEYLPIITERKDSPSAQYTVEKALQALLEMLAKEKDALALSNLGIAFGNTEYLIKPDQLVNACKPLDKNIVEKMAKGIRSLRTTSYRSDLLKALESNFPQIRDPESVLAEVDKMPMNERIGHFRKYRDVIKNWSAFHRRSYYWWIGIGVENSQGLDAALPFYAASVQANPSPDAGAWTKFRGIQRTQDKANQLARQYPLPF